jgi:hypothetical protein
MDRLGKIASLIFGVTWLLGSWVLPFYLIFLIFASSTDVVFIVPAIMHIQTCFWLFLVTTTLGLVHRYWLSFPEWMLRFSPLILLHRSTPKALNQTAQGVKAGMLLANRLFLVIFGALVLAIIYFGFN